MVTSIGIQLIDTTSGEPDLNGNIRRTAQVTYATHSSGSNPRAMAQQLTILPVYFSKRLS
ncbi:MAG: hypothetical protein AAFX51_02415 [Cyanobacteria bacterium J06636_28]